MKKIFLFILPLLAISFGSCSKSNNDDIPSGAAYLFELDARKIQIPTYIQIDSKNWSYKVEYYSIEKDWLIVEQTGNGLKVSATTQNMDELRNRAASIKFIKDGNPIAVKILNSDGTSNSVKDVNIVQNPFEYTNNEWEILQAGKIINNIYSYISIELDVSSINTGKGEFLYNGEDFTFNVPVAFSIVNSKYESTNIERHYISIGGDEDIVVSGIIYTGINTNGSRDESGKLIISHYSGEFSLGVQSNDFRISLTHEEKKVWEY